MTLCQSYLPELEVLISSNSIYKLVTLKIRKFKQQGLLEYSARNYIQYPVTNQNVCYTHKLNHFAIEQK